MTRDPSRRNFCVESGWGTEVGLGVVDDPRRLRRDHKDTGENCDGR